MALKVDQLVALGVTRLRKPGCHNDGAGLYLQVSPSGSKSWVFRYKRAKRLREMGLGSINTFRLSEARARAKSADDYIDAHKDSWKNAKHAYQWRQTIDTQAKPIMGVVPVADIDTDPVLQVLRTIWATTRARSLRWRSATRSVTRSRWPTGGVTCSRNARP